MKTVYEVETRIGDVRIKEDDKENVGCFLRETVYYDNHRYVASMMLEDRYITRGFVEGRCSIFEDGVGGVVLSGINRIGSKNTEEAVRIARCFFDKEREGLVERRYVPQ